MTKSTKQKLTDKQELFIRHYLTCWNATEAARLAGYSGNYNTLKSVGTENLKKPAILDEIKRVTDGMHQDLRTKAQRLLHRPKKRKSTGVIYFLREHGGLIKVGKTFNFESRLSNLQTMVPRGVEVVMLIASEDIHNTEKNLHDRFAHKRVNGEWFELDNNDLVAVAMDYKEQSFNIRFSHG